MKIDKFSYRSDLETTIFVSFHQKISTTRQSYYSYRIFQPYPTQKSLQEPILCWKQVLNKWEQLGCVAHSSLSVGMTLALLFSLRKCNDRTQSVPVNIACTKRLLIFKQKQLSMYATRVCVPGAQKFFRRSSKFPFSTSFGQVYIFEESPKSFQDVLGDVYCPGKYFFNIEKYDSLDGKVTTPRSISGSGKYGAWLFAHKIHFTFKEHVKPTKTDKTRFFIAEKRWTWYSTNNCSLLAHFRQPNLEGRRKICLWTAKCKALLEMCIVQHVKIKSVFTCQPIKRPVCTTVKS